MIYNDNIFSTLHRIERFTVYELERVLHMHDFSIKDISKYFSISFTHSAICNMILHIAHNKNIMTIDQLKKIEQSGDQLKLLFFTYCFNLVQERHLIDLMPLEYTIPERTVNNLVMIIDEYNKSFYGVKTKKKENK
jgi:hypothetical protein